MVRVFADFLLFSPKYSADENALSNPKVLLLRCSRVLLVVLAG
jgi:hypothetical protein